MTHDQNFKNLILDYPRDAITLFTGEDAAFLNGARITPVRQEQLQERLGERFRELDVPLLVEWPDGHRAAIVFVIEEETEPTRFSVHRLAHYCLDLAELLDTHRVVPVVVFLHPGTFPDGLVLAHDAREFLRFHFLAYALPRTPARDHFGSRNLVARLNLPNMAYAPADKLEVYAQAIRGLSELEPDPERRAKYLDFIDIYTALDDNERAIWRQRYPNEVVEMTRFAERFIEQGVQQGVQQGLKQGVQQGVQQGEARVLRHLLTMKFGALPQEVQSRVGNADADTLLRWSEQVLTAETLDVVFH